MDGAADYPSTCRDPEPGKARLGVLAYVEGEFVAPYIRIVSPRCPHMAQVGRYPYLQPVFIKEKYFGSTEPQTIPPPTEARPDQAAPGRAAPPGGWIVCGTNFLGGGTVSGAVWRVGAESRVGAGTALDSVSWSGGEGRGYRPGRFLAPVRG